MPVFHLNQRFEVLYGTQDTCDQASTRRFLEAYLNTRSVAVSRPLLWFAWVPGGLSGEQTPVGKSPLTGDFPIILVPSAHSTRLTSTTPSTQLHPNSQHFKGNKTSENNWTKKATHGHAWHSAGAILPCVPRRPSWARGAWRAWRPSLTLVTLQWRRGQTNNNCERKRPRSPFQHFTFVLSNPRLYYKKNPNNQEPKAWRQFACQQEANKYSCWASWVDTVWNQSSGTRTLSSPKECACYYNRAGRKLLHNFIHDNAASVIFTLLNKMAAFIIGQISTFS